jgi:hypothetical protein
MSLPVFALSLLITELAFGEGGAPVPGVGTSPVLEQKCLNCHDDDMGASWGQLSSHKLLFDCTMCHTLTTGAGKGHAGARACADCHSSKTHPTPAACSTCHDVHGAANAFLVRAAIPRADGSTVEVHVTKPEGAGVDGLVRAGVAGAAAGTGLCEVCHQGLAHYNADGSGSNHPSDYCATCHPHEVGFAPSPVR